MQCPVCNESLEAITHEGIEIESCHKCNGAWFDKNELSSYLKKRAERFNRSRTQKNIIVKKNSDFVIQSGGFCPKCNQVVEQKSVTSLNLKMLKCYGCQGVWVRISHLTSLAQWFEKASPLDKLSLFDQEFRTWDAASDGPIVASLLNLIEDENPRRVFPWATVFLLIINLVIFIWYAIFPENLDSRLMVPALLLTEPFSHLPRVFTSMFMHAGIFHLLGNMYFLWVFGDNVEDRIGALKYITLYLACGIVADFAHAFATNNPDIPALGASGAISGILGGTFFYIQKSGYQFLHCSISGHIPLPCQFGFIWEYGFSVSNG